MNTLTKFLTRIFITINSFFLVLPFTAYANDLDPIPKLKNGEGLLLLDIQVDAPSAVMTLKGARTSQVVIKLAPTHGRWLIMPIPRGEYQIINIKVPYFDLPHIKSTEKNPRWRIKVARDQLNYAGRIEIERERMEKHVAIKKLNRLITDLPVIQKELSEILTIYPLADGNDLRDDFAAQSLMTGIDRE